jgi:hypothetical protein
MGCNAKETTKQILFRNIWQDPTEEGSTPHKNCTSTGQHEHRDRQTYIHVQHWILTHGPVPERQKLHDLER